MAKTKKAAEAAAEVSAQLPGDDLFSTDFVFESDRDYGSRYPVITWLNGIPTRGSGPGFTGCFFFDVDTGIEVQGVEEYTHVNNKGESIPGFALESIELCAIHVRRAWTVNPAEGLPQRFAWNQYEDAKAVAKPRGMTHVLGYIKGCGDLVCVVFPGLSGNAYAARGKEPGIHENFGTKVVMPTRRLKDHLKHLPTYALYQHIGPGYAADGKPAFKVVGKPGKQATINMPVWKNAPEDGLFKDKAVAEAFIGKLYVGTERVRNATEVSKGEGQVWWEAWSPDKLAALRNRGRPTVDSREKAPVDDSDEGAVPAADSMVF